MEGVLREGLEHLAEFAKGSTARPNFVYAGIFYVPETSDTQLYRKNLAGIFYKFLRSSREEQNRARQALRECLNDPNYEIEHAANYPQLSVEEWQQPYYTLHKAKETWAFERFRERVRLSVVSLHFHSGLGRLLFLHIRDTKGKSLSTEAEWAIREDLLAWWLSQEQDSEVRDYLARVQEALLLIRRSSEHLYKKSFSVRKIANYLFPIDLARFADTLWVSRARVFKRELTAKDLWKTFTDSESEEDIKDLSYLLEKEKPSMSLETFFLPLLEKALNEEFLARLRDRWTHLLRSSCTFSPSDSPLTILPFDTKPSSSSPTLSFGTYRVPFRKIAVLCFFEKGFEIKTPSGRLYERKEIVRHIIEGLNEISQKYGQRPALKFYEFESKSSPTASSKAGIYDLSTLLGKALPILRGEIGDKRRRSAQDLLNGESEDLVEDLVNFSTFLQRMVANMQKKSEDALCILLFLNTEFENGQNRYPLWDYVRFIYEYYGMPVQTLTKRSVKEVLESENKDAILKNILISLLKDAKQLEVKHQHFNLPTGADGAPILNKVFIIVELPSSSFFYTRGGFSEGLNEERHRHFLYEIYRIELTSESLRVRLDKKFLLMLGYFGDHEKKFKSWLSDHLSRKDERIYFVSAYSSKERESPILKHILSQEPENFVQLSYIELPTTYIQSQNAKEEERSLFVLFPEQIREIFEQVEELRDLKDRTFIGFKPAFPRVPEYKEFHHTHLQLFEVLFSRFPLSAQERDLLLLSLIALSFYESESFLTPYAKLNLKAQERNVYLRIRRGPARQEYIFSLKAALYELLYRISWLPPREGVT